MRPSWYLLSPCAQCTGFCFGGETFALTCGVYTVRCDGVSRGSTGSPCPIYLWEGMQWVLYLAICRVRRYKSHALSWRGSVCAPAWAEAGGSPGLNPPPQRLQTVKVFLRSDFHSGVSPDEAMPVTPAEGVTPVHRCGHCPQKWIASCTPLSIRCTPPPCHLALSGTKTYDRPMNKTCDQRTSTCESNSLLADRH